jgi:hypothetical protein
MKEERQMSITFVIIIAEGHCNIFHFEDWQKISRVTKYLLISLFNSNNTSSI